MKFGKRLKNEYREGWAGKYINYKKLKQELQSQTFSVGDGSKSLEDSEEEFFYLLCQELERVLDFFTSQKIITQKRLKTAVQQVFDCKAEETETLLQELCYIRSNFIHLEEFLDLNYAGLNKILKKYDKRMHSNLSFSFFSNMLPRYKVFSTKNLFQSECKQISEIIESLAAAAGLKLLDLERNPEGKCVEQALTKNDPVLLAMCTNELSLKQSSLEGTFLRACQLNAVACVTHLVESLGVKVDCRDPVSKQTGLHHACTGGFLHLVRYLLSKNIEVNCRDFRGQSPLLCAVLNNHPEVVLLLVHESNVDLHLMDNEMKTALYYAITLEMHNILDILINKTDVNRVCHGLHEELPIFVASRLGKDRVLQSLLKSNADVNTLSSSGENALHFACKAGTVACSSLLIQTGIEINRKNLKNGRTPLIVAARMGHADCVQLLLEHFCDTGIPDNQNLTAYAYAVYRNKSSVARLLKPFVSRECSYSDLQDIQCTPKKEHFSDTGSHRSVHVLKKDEKCLQLIVGQHTEAPAFDLYRLSDAHSLRAQIRCNGEMCSKFNLPLEDPLTVDCLVSVHEAFNVVVEIIDRDSMDCVGRCWIMPPDKQSHYIPNISVFVIGNDFKPVGKFHYTLLLITPFFHESMSSDFRSSTYENFPLIGHRGSGSNKTALLNTMNISENTVLSFVTANQRGAEYVELDVQLTKDKIPIIYHDYTVSETGFNLPLSRLTLIEFLALKDNKITTPQPKTLSRSRSEHSLLEHEALKINDSFPSLKMGLLVSHFYLYFLIWAQRSGWQNTPTNIGFNIELKVPLEDEAEREGIPMVDLDDYGEKVLACVFANAKGRKILFSSFHPDVCSVFARKQSRYPVYLLTSAGSENHLDIRCNSLQGAVRFAKSNNLRGIVSKGEPILECPELVGIVKSLNLALITWGDENNNVSNVRLQQLLGVDAVIMDHVACVKKGLVGFLPS
ncbi:uncharacterized protein LOC135142457 isoform X2 [Zophobas morio]|uniref:uncharacterized protein LOC135142457 isoform X2 n=1 Tax=Zophobas morio TaxID=2755281 RepID=UPI003082B191